MDPARNQEMLETTLWKIECLINFHREEEFHNNYPRLRKALVIAHQSVQALGPTVVMFEHQETPVTEPVLKSLVIRV